MASWANIPNELILLIVGHLTDLSDIAAFAQASHMTYDLANPALYRRARSSHPYLLCWASDLRRVGTVRKLLAAGAIAGKSWMEGGYPVFLESFALPGEFDDYFTALHNRIEGPEVHSSEPGVEGLEIEMFEDRTDSTDGGEDTNGTKFVPFKPSKWMLDEPFFPSLRLGKPLTTIGEVPPHEAQGSRLWYPLHLAARGGHIEVAELLLSHGADIDKTTRKICGCKRTILDREDRHDKVAYAQEESDRKFLESSVPVTPLHMALCHRQQEMAILLLQRGAVHTFDHPRWKAHVLHTAAAFGCLDVIRFLLEGDDPPNIDVQDSRGLTPLFYAYSTRQRATMLWLLQKGADVNVQLGSRITLLHLACLDGAFAIACHLIDAGADVNRPWHYTICYFLGERRPLELCCALHHTKSRRAYAGGNALLHERKFESRRLELMKKLLDAGASTRPIRQLPPSLSFPSSEISAVTIAASHHSIPMLELLAASGVDMSREGLAIREAIYPTFMQWTDITDRDPLPTLRWLVAHGVPVDPESNDIVDALVFVCALPEDCPWRDDVFDWFLTYNIPPDFEIMVRSCSGRFERLHKMDPISQFDSRSTTPFREAFRANNFAMCKALLNSQPRPSLVEAFRLLASLATHFGSRTHLWQNPYSDQEEPHRVNRERLAFLLEADEEEAIKHSPATFMALVGATQLPPTDLLLEAPLPTKAAFLEKFPIAYRRGAFVTEQVNRFFDVQDQYDATKAPRDWDSAFRLVMLILRRNWTAARFLLQHGADVDWAQENGMEYFPPVLSALELAPSPSSIGRDTYNVLLGRWDERVGRLDTDVRVALFHEACGGPVDITHFLADDELDVNAVDGNGNSALHRMFEYHENESRSPSVRDYYAGHRLLQLLRAGADPRAVNNDGKSVLTYFNKRVWIYWTLLRSLRLRSFVEEFIDDKRRIEISFRLDGEEETFVYE